MNTNMQENKMQELNLDALEQVNGGWLVTITAIVAWGVIMSTIPYICD